MAMSREELEAMGLTQPDDVVTPEENEERKQGMPTLFDALADEQMEARVA